MCGQRAICLAGEESLPDGRFSEGVGQAEQDEEDCREKYGPAEVGEHQYTPVTVRIMSMSLMKMNGAMIPPTP